MEEGDWSGVPYAGWLEDIIREVVNIDPDCLALGMRDKNGKVYTAYWRVSGDDRAAIIAGMEDDDRMEWVKGNREAIRAILSLDDDDEEDEEDEDGDDGWIMSAF